MISDTLRLEWNWKFPHTFVQQPLANAINRAFIRPFIIYLMSNLRHCLVISSTGLGIRSKMSVFIANSTEYYQDALYKLSAVRPQNQCFRSPLIFYRWWGYSNMFNRYEHLIEIVWQKQNYTVFSCLWDFVSNFQRRLLRHYLETPYLQLFHASCQKFYHDKLK